MVTDGFTMCIYSSRSREEGAIAAMRAWFNKHGFLYTNELQFPTQKPTAFMTIDDRAFCFEGDFPSPHWIRRFIPWNKRARKARAKVS